MRISTDIQISSRGKYCLVVMTYLAMHYPPVSLKDISNQLGISLSYLEQLSARLKKENLVVQNGRDYELAKPAAEITLGEIFEVSQENIDTRTDRSYEDWFTNLYDFTNKLVLTKIHYLSLADIVASTISLDDINFEIIKINPSETVDSLRQIGADERHIEEIRKATESLPALLSARTNRLHDCSTSTLLSNMLKGILCHVESSNIETFWISKWLKDVVDTGTNNISDKPRLKPDEVEHGKFYTPSRKFG